MQYRRFGSSDLEVSVVTFGAMRFVTGKAADADEQTGTRALAAALDGGVTTIHSSYEYGTRWALTDVLRDHPKRHELHHVIKVTVPDFADAGFDAAKFRGQVEEALRELHAERIAVVQHLQRGVPREAANGEEGDAPRIAAMTQVNEALLEVLEVLRHEGKVGWLATFRTPVKVAHLAGNPHTTLSYWNPRQNAVHVDGVASWEDAADTRHHVWDLYRHGSPPGLGYEPRNFWRGGPDDPTFGVLRIDPWRVQIIRGRDLRSLIWQAPDRGQVGAMGV
jgi:hypothetical protein